MESSRSNINGDDEPPHLARTSSSSSLVASEYSSDVVVDITPRLTLELPSDDDDDDAPPEPPQQTAARYDLMEGGRAKDGPEDKTEETGDDDEDPLPGRTTVHELSPPIPFNVAAVQDNEKEVAAVPPVITTQAKPPTPRGNLRSTLDVEEESIMIPPDDEEVGYARSSQRRSFTFRSAQSQRGNVQNQRSRVHEPQQAIMPLETREQSVPMFHEVEARLVEEEPNTPVIDAIPMQEVSWWQKYQRYIFGGMCVLLIGLAVAVGVSLGSNNSTSSSESSLTASTQGAANTTLGFVDVSIRGNMTLQGVNSLDINSDSVDEIADVLTVAMEEILPEGATVRIVSVGGYPVTEDESSAIRFLQGNYTNISTLTGEGGQNIAVEGITVEFEIILGVEFEVALSEDCKTSACRDFEVDELSTLLAQDIVSDLRSKIKSGELSDAIQEEATAAGISELQNVVVEPDSLEISEPTVTVRLQSPSLSSSSSPSPPPSPSSKYCFQDKDELKYAVDVYITQDCTNNSGCRAGQQYGWPMNSWCVSKVTDMGYLFWGKETFNEDLSGWDVSRVTNMEHMFSNFGGPINIGTSFNGDISTWNVSLVTNMQYMFAGASSFNSDISNWDVSSVISMMGTFSKAQSFNQNLCAWGDKFPYGDAVGIFEGSGCTFQDDPQGSYKKGPFCASACRRAS